MQIGGILFNRGLLGGKPGIRYSDLKSDNEFWNKTGF